MIIKTREWRGEIETTVQIYMLEALEKDKNGLGKFEIQESGLGRVMDAFARLCDILAEKKILEASDITKIATGHSYSAEYGCIDV